MEAINDPSRSNIQIDHNNQSSTSSDDEEIRKVDQPDAPSPYLHNACIRLNFGNEETASIISKSIIMEHKRDNSKKNFSHDGTFVVADISSSDVKSLMKTMSNFSDMCMLSKSVIDATQNYSLNN